MKMTCN